jgi:hypothetical protein
MESVIHLAVDQRLSPQRAEVSNFYTEFPVLNERNGKKEFNYLALF